MLVSACAIISLPFFFGGLLRPGVRTRADKCLSGKRKPKNYRHQSGLSYLERKRRSTQVTLQTEAYSLCHPGLMSVEPLFRLPTSTRNPLFRCMSVIAVAE
jgi:hypothetical protein